MFTWKAEMTTVGRISFAALTESIDAPRIGHSQRALRMGGALEAEQRSCKLQYIILVKC